MKKIILIISICLFTIPGLAQQTQFKPADINIEGLSGKVKRIDEETAAVKMKDGVPAEVNRRRTRSVIFDKDGRLTYEWTQIEKLAPFEQNYYYDKKGNRHRRTSREDLFSAEPSKIGKEQLTVGVFSFDPAGNALFETIYRGDE